MKKELDAFLYYLSYDCNLSRNTCEAYKNDLTAFGAFLSAEGISSVQDVTPDHLRRFLDRGAEDALAPKTIDRRTSCLRMFHRFLHAEGRIPTDPSAFLDPPARSSYLPNYLSAEEVDAMITAIPSSGTKFAQRDRVIMELLFGCGLRVSELCDLKQQSLKLKSRFLWVRGKGDKERIVPLGDIAFTAVEEYRAGEYLSLKSGHSKDWFILSRSGRRLDRHAVFRIVTDLAALVGLEGKVSPHTLRHSFATELVGGGADLRSVQELLGHANIVTTEIYTHVDNARLKGAHKKFHPRG